MESTSPPSRHPPQRRLPPWLRKTLPAGGELRRTADIVARSGVATVCQEAHCPNQGECWSRRTATFMILGDLCTRRCRFCAVATARPKAPDANEPEKLAEACAALGLRHVVITAVARDDLPDEGAGHFARCVETLRRHCPTATIEVLPADFHARRECIETLCQARPDVYNHNIETVERLTPIVRPQAKYHRSLEVPRIVKSLVPDMTTKSGLMIGLGETHDEILATLTDLRGAGCDMLTIGQYLQPSPAHAPVARYYEPAEFDALGATARELGFAQVAAGPFVRSSYHAAEDFDALATSG
ncbi:MAG: lipoyl synthase [Phycisphaerae bacterium]|nr:lipoyl synthase [Phycisphaerae bacterium]